MLKQFLSLGSGLIGGNGFKGTHLGGRGFKGEHTGGNGFKGRTHWWEWIQRAHIRGSGFRGTHIWREWIQRHTHILKVPVYFPFKSGFRQLDVKYHKPRPLIFCLNLVIMFLRLISHKVDIFSLLF